MEKSRKDEAEGRFAENFDNFDTDADGNVTKEENSWLGEPNLAVGEADGWKARGSWRKLIGAKVYSFPVLSADTNPAAGSEIPSKLQHVRLVSNAFKDDQSLTLCDAISNRWIPEWHWPRN